MMTERKTVITGAYKTRIVALSDIPEMLPRNGTVLVPGCSAASNLLASAVMNAGEALGALNFTGIVVSGLNRETWLANEQCHFTTFFMTPELRAAGDAVTFLPLNYRGILSHLRETRIDAALFSVSPPDETGMCSFGPTVDFVADLWPRIPLRIAHINPLLPRTAGSTEIPFDQIHAFVEAPEPLPTMADDAGVDPISIAIAELAALFIGDGVTLQTGLGKLPGAMLRVLKDRRQLRIHSGLIGDAVLDLLEAGAIERGSDVVAGVAIGSTRLYDALPDAGFHFCPVSHTHSPAVIAGLPDFVSINSAMEVDLFGQGHAEVGPGGWASGPGGASDFAHGAAAADGLRIVALPASAKGISRIVPATSGRGPVSLGRFDIDIVVTEHGAADLRSLDHDARAAAMVAIAAPEHREDLSRGWREGAGRY